MPLFLLFVAIPIIEIALFIEVGGWLGLWPTLAIVILTAFLGTLMLRRQGLQALANLQGRMAAGENPGQLLADGALILVAGVLLLTPGFFTDAVGFLLLVPGVRSRVIVALARQVRVKTAQAHHADTNWQRPGEQTVDGEWSENDTNPSPRSPGGSDQDRLT